MSLPVTLTLTGAHHLRLLQHLLPGDGKEAVAILLCARRQGDRRQRLLLREIVEIPYDLCSERTPVSVTWPTELIEEILDRAAAAHLSVLKIHSHPRGFRGFSLADDNSDKILLPMIRSLIEADIPHGSVVMLPNGEMFGRVYQKDGLTQIASINVVGDDLHFWHSKLGTGAAFGFTASHAQMFDQGTIDRLQQLSVAVIGCSGTGSPLVEQLVRLGVGEIVIVDDDHVEDRNINRIVNSSMQDADGKRLKVDVIGDAIERMGLGTKVIRIAKNLWDPDVVRSVAQCQIVFGCMDTVDGRFLLNTLATYYLQGYFDVGVRLDAIRAGDGAGRIREVCGSVHFLQPGKSSLLTRGLFDLRQVAEAGLRRNDPKAHKRQLDDGYIKGGTGNRPAVISVNMLAASLAVTELLARIHPFRECANREYGTVTFSLQSVELFIEAEEGVCDVLSSHSGKGDVVPLLRLMELADRLPM